MCVAFKTSPTPRENIVEPLGHEKKKNLQRKFGKGLAKQRLRVFL